MNRRQLIAVTAAMIPALLLGASPHEDNDIRFTGTLEADDPRLMDLAKYDQWPVEVYNRDTGEKFTGVVWAINQEKGWLDVYAMCGNNVWVRSQEFITTYTENGMGITTKLEDLPKGCRPVPSNDSFAIWRRYANWGLRLKPGAPREVKEMLERPQ